MKKNRCLYGMSAYSKQEEAGMVILHEIQMLEKKKRQLFDSHYDDEDPSDADGERPVLEAGPLSDGGSREHGTADWD